MHFTYLQSVQGRDSLCPDFRDFVFHPLRHVGVDLLVHRLVDFERVAQMLQEPIYQHADPKSGTRATNLNTGIKQPVRGGYFMHLQNMNLKAIFTI